LQAQLECVNTFTGDIEIKSGVTKERRPRHKFFARATFYGVMYAFVCNAFVSVAIFYDCGESLACGVNFCVADKKFVSVKFHL